MSDGLTPRQLEIAHLVAQGWIYKHIAQRLGISEKTVKHHIEDIAERLHFDRRLGNKVQIVNWIRDRAA